MNGRNGVWTISDYVPQDLSELAAMVAARIRRQRRAVPILMAHFEAPEVIVPLIENLTQHGSVVVARQNGRIAGFLGGWTIERFFGDRNGVFVPEYGFGTDTCEPERQIEVFRKLYEERIAVWRAGGWLNHAIITYEVETKLRDFLFFGGFGGVVLDAVRPAVAMRLPVPADIRIREVKREDAAAMEAWRQLHDAHRIYMESPPLYLEPSEPEDLESMTDWITQPSHYAWIAEDAAGAPFSYLQMEPQTEGTSMLVHDARNLAVTGAFTRSSLRGNGVATLLLDAALTRAQELGMVSVSVDFESRNTPAVNFWTRHFTPFTFSVVRCLADPNG